ncbi:hypothetical protein NDU88_000834 [Pleurodeles waltl]|uniref:Uncharacterized protein n=1 Tax=Pleurodeles waltl TaxID=8319 RepID=A0AAV7L9J8_PLEWA|nr:hypothetical protein NDU88_000834 [Pleurodeles waltl]
MHGVQTAALLALGGGVASVPVQGTPPGHAQIPPHTLSRAVSSFLTLRQALLARPVSPLTSFLPPVSASSPAAAPYMTVSRRRRRKAIPRSPEGGLVPAAGGGRQCAAAAVAAARETQRASSPSATPIREPAARTTLRAGGGGFSRQRRSTSELEAPRHAAIPRGVLLAHFQCIFDFVEGLG